MYTYMYNNLRSVSGLSTVLVGMHIIEVDYQE